MKSSIVPTPPKQGLFAAARNVTDQVQPEEWAEGWQLVSACPAGGVWCCSDSEVPEDPEDVVLKADASAPDKLVFQAFDVYQVMGCTAGASRLEQANYTAAARSWMAANIEGWVSAALEVGVCENSSLIALPEVVEDAAAVCLEQAVSSLLKARATARLFDRPTIHFPAWAAPYWDTSTAVNNVVDIVFGTGYGILPAAVVDDVTGWAYVTGTVEFALGAESAAPDTLDERRMNRVEVIEERKALVRFDPCGSFRIQFCVPSCDCAVVA